MLCWVCTARGAQADSKSYSWYFLRVGLISARAFVQLSNGIIKHIVLYTYGTHVRSHPPIYREQCTNMSIKQCWRDLNEYAEKRSRCSHSINTSWKSPALIWKQFNAKALPLDEILMNMLYKLLSLGFHFLYRIQFLFARGPAECTKP